MKSSRRWLLISLLIFLLLILSSIISALINLINLQSILILLVLITLIINLKGLKWFRQLIRKYLYKPNKRRFVNYIPKNKRLAAKKSLHSIDRLIEQIQNKVELTSILKEKERIEKDLARGDIIIVVFGTGSTGKTSIVRSLLKEIVGDVGPDHGTTDKSYTYKLSLRGLDRSIKIIDTPGIYESGELGKSRKKDSLLRASRADLIIIVVDNDLRSVEAELINSLSKAGKKLLIVLNKSDLRGQNEIDRLLRLIRNKTYNLVLPDNIVATSASPQSIPRPGNNPIQPQPEIGSLITRIATILQEEGEDLISDNILLQCQSLGLSGKRLLNNQRKNNALSCIDKYAWISSGVVAITPLPGIDLLGAAAVNGQMVMEIAKIYGLSLTKKRAKELALSVGKTLGGLGIIKSGVSLISNALSVTLPTILLSRVIQGISAAWLTRIAGQSFITYFSQDQDWGDGGIQEVVQYHFELNSRENNLRKFMQIAFEKVIEPIRENNKKELPPHQMLQEEEEV